MTPLHLRGLAEIRASPSSTLLLEQAEWLRPPAAFVADLSGTPRPPPTATQPFALTRHARFRTVLEDQLVFGFHHLHALIGPDNVFTCQDIAGSAGRIRHHIADHPGPQFNIPAFRQEGSVSFVSFESLRRDEVVRLDGPVFLGSPIEPENWGMWLLQGIPAAADFVACGQEGQFLCYAAHPWQRRLLSAMGVRADRVLDQGGWVPYQAARITLHQYSTFDLIPREPDITLFRALHDRACEAIDVPACPRLFLSRRHASRGSTYRALLNEAELIAALERMGFLTIEAEFLSLEEQVVLFGQAEIVVGLGGAALFNTVFCAPGTKVVSIESSAMFLHQHASLLAALGHRYAFILGREDTSTGRFRHNPWTLDIARAVALIADFAAS